MEVFAEGFAPREVQFAIVEQNPTMLNITLYKVRRETFEKRFKSKFNYSPGCPEKRRESS